MKPVEYAQELGISRQAVYAKIKRGILRAKNVEGKLYIVVDKIESQDQSQSKKETNPKTKYQLLLHQVNNKTMKHCFKQKMKRYLFLREQSKT